MQQFIIPQRRYKAMIIPTRDPRTGKIEQAHWITDYFEQGQDGVRFPDGSTYNPAYYKLKLQ